nr:hypothetical protein [Tanacetum cinerariifolium]
MMISFRSLKKSVVNITNSSTNKAFQVLVDPSHLRSPFNSRYELLAPCYVLLSPESRIHTQIKPLDLEFLDSVSQCFKNPCQRAITELVYFVEPHDLLLIVVDRERYCLRRLNDGIVMLELVVCSIPSWFSERIMSINIELLSIKPPVRDAIFCTYVIEELCLNSNMTWRTTIDSDLISFWIPLVNLICEHLVTLLPLELKMEEEEEEEVVGETNKILMLLKYLEYQMCLLEEVEVVVVTVETHKEFLVVVVVDVGSREPDCDIVRSITGVVIGGTNELSSFPRFCREDRVTVELAGFCSVEASVASKSMCSKFGLI